MSAPPPPRRTVASPAPSTSAEPVKQGWKDKAKGWGLKGFDKAMIVSDKIGVHANNLAKQVGGERIWPTTGDFAEEIAKCCRILRAFTVDGIERTVEETDAKGLKKKGKTFLKIPAKLIQQAKGIVIYTSFRTGVAPFGGAGGGGVILARLPDGSWSAPSAIAPGNFSAGLMLGLDIFDAVLLINTDAAMETFLSHKVTLGGEVGVTAGIYGAGGVAEAGVTDRSPVYSYVKARGLYAGVEALAQAYLCRFDENERVYGCMGVTQKEILTGHFRPTPEAAPLYEALRAAESGAAQRAHGAEFEFEQPYATHDAAHSGATPVPGTPVGESLEDPATAPPPDYAVPPMGDEVVDGKKRSTPPELPARGPPPSLPPRGAPAADTSTASGDSEAQAQLTTFEREEQQQYENDLAAAMEESLKVDGEGWQAPPQLPPKKD
ncbi:hypothetical protein Rhopal_002325-T1 [Rhodotorula paludigena]|uniref:Ysc84 actin-binding domain-containing protein n=1 Tax=Rhodotorula paludigena TaxID=86838 RepID=A0AAV5G9X5_9BASI|nr:hypothetical protein Rhopal_002325-T1 [Rhodotorula paludigena]